MKKKEIQGYCVESRIRAARRKKWNSIHTHSHVWGKHAAGKIADILRQCYAFVISHAGIVTLGSSLAMFVLHARLTASLSQCCSMPSPKKLQLFCNNVDHHAIDRVYSFTYQSYIRKPYVCKLRLKLKFRMPQLICWCILD